MKSYEAKASSAAATGQILGRATWAAILVGGTFSGYQIGDYLFQAETARSLRSLDTNIVCDPSTDTQQAQAVETAVVSSRVGSRVADVALVECRNAVGGIQRRAIVTIEDDRGDFKVTTTLDPNGLQLRLIERAVEAVDFVGRENFRDGLTVRADDRPDDWVLVPTVRRFNTGELVGSVLGFIVGGVGGYFAGGKISRAGESRARKIRSQGRQEESDARARAQRDAIAAASRELETSETSESNGAAIASAGAPKPDSTEIG